MRAPASGVTPAAAGALLELDLLRAFVVARESGGLGRAARRLGRTPSAVSLMMGRLEERAGCILFRREGRTLGLTEQGERLLAHARRMLQLNGEALAELGSAGASRTLRIGAPQDVAEQVFPGVLSRFVREHPEVRLEARVDRSAGLVTALAQGELDLVVALARDAPPPAQKLAEAPLRFLAAASFALPPPGEPLPLVLFDAPCEFRAAALAALDAAGVPWRIALTSPSLAVLGLAVRAGLGVTVRTPLWLPRGVRLLSGRSLPALPSTSLWLIPQTAPYPAPAEWMAALLHQALAGRNRARPAPK